MIRAKAPAFVIVVVLAAITAVYANHFHNGFHFDDAHTIENNAAELALTNGADSQKILEASLGRLRIRKFELASPSLEEIFIEKVGAETLDVPS